MYKAIKEIGGYKIGEEVPTEKAEVWFKMYSVPHVEKIDGEEKSVPDKKENSIPGELKPSEDKSVKDPMLDDYLGRNTTVVKKNVEEDDLSQEQFKNLLELEKSNKKRTVVIQAIQKRLN